MVATLAGTLLIASVCYGEELDLIFLVRATGEYNEQRMRDAFSDAGVAEECESFEVEPISTAQYELYKTIITDPESFTYGSDFTPTLERDGERSGSWKVHQPDPGERLKGIFVLNHSSESDQPKVTFHETQDASSDDAAFRVIQEDEGKYEFKHRDGQRPLKYHLCSPNGDPSNPPPLTEFFDWPSESLKYVLRLKGFHSGEEGLKRIQRELENGLLQFELSDVQAGLFSFAAFRSVAGTTEAAWSGEIYTITCGGLGGSEVQKPNKAWVLFPLTKKQRDEAKTLLDEAQYSERTLAEMLNGLGDASYPVFRATSENEVNLNFSETPTWHELPPVNNAFSRSFRVDINDVPRWRKLFRAGEAYAIVVYEGSLFRGGKVVEPRQPRAIPVKNVNTGQNGLWRVGELFRWNEGLKRLGNVN